MNKEITKEFMTANCGCYSERQLNECSFMKGELSLESILNSEIPLKDKYWFVCKKLATKEENQQIAIGVAEIMLHVYEEKHPNDDRPRKAIQAAKDYLAGVIDIDELIAKRRDAYAAAAADAAAADAAAYAYAAYAAADAAGLKDALFKFLINFCKAI